MVHKAAVLSLDFSKAMSGDKLLLASGDALGCLKVWKVQSGKCLREFELGIGAKGGISSLKFIQGDVKVVFASLDRQIRVFGLKSGAIICVMPTTHEGYI